MTYASISPKFQIVIPKEIRQKIAIKPGQKMMIYERNGLIYLIPDMPLKKLRGLLKAHSAELQDFSDLRDKSDRRL